MQSSPRPVPGLDPKPINIDQYSALTPEKLELLDGYLVDEPDKHEERRNLLLLLLTNEGLAATVALAHVELWQEALQIVYG